MTERTRIQNEAYDKWTNLETNAGTLVAGTGFGKSRVLALAVCETLKDNPEANGLVLTPTIELKSQLREEFLKWGYSEDIVNRIQFECIQTAYEWETNHFTVVAADEIHLMLSAEYYKFFENNTYDRLICCTATVPTNVLHKIKLENLAPVFFTYSLDESVASGFVAPYDIWCTPIKLLPEEETKYKKIMKTYEFYERDLGGWEAFDTAKAALDGEYDATLPEAELKDLKKSAFIFLRAVRERRSFLLSVTAKYLLTEAVCNVYEKDSIIFLFNGTNAISDEMAKRIKGAASWHSGVSKTKRKKLLEEFKKGKIRVLSTTNAANQGLSVDNASVGVLTGITSASITMIQRVGRLLRLVEGKRAKVIIPYLPGSQEEKWVQKATSGLKNVHFVNSLKEIYETEN